MRRSPNRDPQTLALLLTLALCCPLWVFADGPTTRPAPIRYATSRQPGAGTSSGPVIDRNGPQHTPWDHPFINADAENSLNNLRYGNVDALAPFGSLGGFGLGWIWGGGFGATFNTGWGGLPW